jgi:arginase
LTVREAFLAVEMLAASQKLLAIDMVEVNPILDEKNKTGILASELVLAALGKVVY